MIRSLENYNPNRGKYNIQKTNTLLNAIEFYKGRKMIIIAFENDIFPLTHKCPSGMDDSKKYEMNSSEFMPEKKESSISLASPSFQHDKWTKKERQKNEMNSVSEFSKPIIGKKNIKQELFKKHFRFQSPIDMLMDVCKKNNKHKLLVNLIKNGLIDLRNEIESR